VSNTKSFSTSGEMVVLIGSLKQRSIFMKKKVSGLRFLADVTIRVSNLMLTQLLGVLSSTNKIPLGFHSPRMSGFVKRDSQS
jgi:hypothetical protein